MPDITETDRSRSVTKQNTTSTLMTWAVVTTEAEIQTNKLPFLYPWFTKIKSSSLDLDETDPTFTTEYRNGYWLLKNTRTVA